MKVLIAEDDVETLEYLQSGLRELGHVCTGASG
ncbi:MAG: response regulator transcription factor, partial [Proteobacteria bacterium]|nr:response regulator transcription factor [Pseudomonadota bacterium]